MNNPPTGTVTFLFTDIEGSTKRWEQHSQQMQEAVERHDALLRRSIEAYGGYVFKTVGDAFCAAFSTPYDALQAALDAQHALLAEQWDPEVGSVRVRMALHTGIAQEREGDYFGQPVNRVARILSAGHGGQTLLSEVTYGLVRDNLPGDVSLLDLGEHRLKDLIRPERVFQLVTPDLLSEFPALKTLNTRLNNLPLQPTAFIGREKEMAAVCALLRRPEVRLVTLTGPGGTGKTRLALQAAAEMLDDFQDGVYSVELAALTDPALVPSTIAQTLGVSEAVGKPIIESLKDYLKDKQMLLVLDNFEHLVEASGVVGDLLKAALGLKAMATSRMSLHLYGEKEYPVPPFSLPPVSPVGAHGISLRSIAPLPIETLTQYEAVRLFIERAQDVRPDFAVTNDNAPAVAKICVRLDGLPLAIELAAARTRLFPPQALLDRLSSRLKMLTGGARNVPARQQTMRNTIEWSYDLLSEGEKQLFRRMSVFQGGRTFEGLEAVCNYDGQLQVDVLEGVESLVSQSLLQQREGRDSEPRFWMLETIHEYTREMLGESGEGEVVQREHALYFMKLAEEAEPELTGANQAECLHQLEEEHDNIRVALRWSGAHGNAEAAEAVETSETGLRIAGAIWRFWYVRGYFSEGREQLERTLANGGVRSTGADGAIKHVGVGEGEIGRLGEIGRADRVGRAKVLNGAGVLASVQGDYATARSLLEESLAMRRELGDKRGIANSLNSLGLMVKEQGDYATARSLHEESLAIHRELGDKRGIADSLVNLGIVANEQGDYATARSLYKESLAIHRELGDKQGIAISLNNLGNVAQEQGDYATARSLHEESLAMRRELGDKRGVAECLAGLGGVVVGTARTAHISQPQLELAVSECAATLFGAVAAILESIGAVLDAEVRPYERNVAAVRSALGQEAFVKAWAEGRAMSMEQAIEYALGKMEAVGD